MDVHKGRNQGLFDIGAEARYYQQPVEERSCRLIAGAQAGVNRRSLLCPTSTATRQHPQHVERRPRYFRGFDCR